MNSNAFFENVKNTTINKFSILLFCFDFFLHILSLYYQLRFVNPIGFDTYLFFELTFYTFEM